MNDALTTWVDRLMQFAERRRVRRRSRSRFVILLTSTDDFIPSDTGQLATGGMTSMLSAMKRPPSHAAVTRSLPPPHNDSSTSACVIGIPSVGGTAIVSSAFAYRDAEDFTTRTSTRYGGTGSGSLFVRAGDREPGTFKINGFIRRNTFRGGEVAIDLRRVGVEVRSHIDDLGHFRIDDGDACVDARQDRDPSPLIGGSFRLPRVVAPRNPDLAHTFPRNRVHDCVPA